MRINLKIIEVVCLFVLLLKNSETKVRFHTKLIGKINMEELEFLTRVTTRKSVIQFLNSYFFLTFISIYYTKIVRPHIFSSIFTETEQKKNVYNTNLVHKRKGK